MTVFLKGCPLRCMWCHNPEGQAFQSEVVRSPNGCLFCNACLCEGEKKTGRPVLVPESISVCPRNLVRLCGEEISSHDLVKRIDKVVELLKLSGGGVTFSGGEPLAQPEFLRECLALLRGRVHRAIQTSGFCDPLLFSKILADCDYVLFDLKHMDPAIHQKYTGQSNEKILQNYQTLVKSKKEFITRIPLIPSVNDTAENLQATAAFLHENGVRRIELLPYNKSAGAKYRLIGKEYVTDFDGNIPPSPHTEIFEQYQIEVKVL